MQIYSNSGLPLIYPRYEFYSGIENYTPPSDQDEIYATQFSKIFKSFGLGSSAVKIAVLDTGFNPAPLKESFPKYNSGDSYDFSKNNSSVSSYNSHGTKLMYLLGAGQQDGLGMDGFAPGCQIAMYKISDDDGENVTTDNIVNAINKALADNSKIINISFGTTTDTPALRNACQLAGQNGAVIVASVPNHGVAEVIYPAAYSREMDHVIAVGALGHNTFERAGFSSYGDYIDVYTEGEEIKTLSNTYSGGGTFVNSNGVSFSGVIVTATVAHMLSQRADLKPPRIKSILRDSAGPSGSDTTVRYARPFNAVQFARFAPLVPQNNINFTVNNYQALGQLTGNILDYGFFINTMDTYSEYSLASGLKPADVEGTVLGEISKYWGVTPGQVSAGRYWFNLKLQVKLNNEQFELYDQKPMDFVPPSESGYLIGPLNATINSSRLYLENLIGHLKFQVSDIESSLFNVNVYAGRKISGWSASPVRTYENVQINSDGVISIDLAGGQEFRVARTVAGPRTNFFEKHIQPLYARLKDKLQSITAEDMALATLFVATLPFQIIGCGGEANNKNKYLPLLLAGGNQNNPGGPTDPNAPDPTDPNIPVDPNDPSSDPVTMYRFEIIRSSDQKKINIYKTAVELKE